MAASAFKTNPIALSELLKNCESGVLQLPDFQRSWVWDEDRIRSLIASISRAFPVGAVMTLEVGGDVEFKPRMVEGAPGAAAATQPTSLLLDGQQRLTSLYQVALRGEVVETVTPKKKRVKRWFYIDMVKALDLTADREEAIIGVPEDKILRSDFGRKVELDVSTRGAEFAALVFPVSEIFRADGWIEAFTDHYYDAPDRHEKRNLCRQFKNDVIENFTMYQLPVIALDKSTSKEAVCVVFEKVNTGGKPLDAFELITAMYAADGHELRKDWYGDGITPGRHERLRDAYRSPAADRGILADVGNTDFLHVISLLHTSDRRSQAVADGRTGKDLPQVIGNRAALLNLPLDAYKRYEAQAEDGFMKAAQFLHTLHIYRPYDLPYQSQVIPLAGVLAALGSAGEHQATRNKIAQWYWNGVFGELYGSTTETRIARDFVEVPAWIAGGRLPSTITDATFRADRLLTMRMRLSAAYKGVNALLMDTGARDFRSGQKYEHVVFFDEGVDIHHIFPKKWCESQGIVPARYDSIINKTPLSARTNRIIGGVAPTEYLAKLETRTADGPGLSADSLDDNLQSHLIDPTLLRANAFDDFMLDRQGLLVKLIEEATGRSVYTGEAVEEGESAEADADLEEAEHTLALS